MRTMKSNTLAREITCGASRIISDVQPFICKVPSFAFLLAVASIYLYQVNSHHPSPCQFALQKRWLQPCACVGHRLSLVKENVLAGLSGNSLSLVPCVSFRESVFVGALQIRRQATYPACFKYAVPVIHWLCSFQDSRYCCHHHLCFDEWHPGANVAF